MIHLDRQESVCPVVCHCSPPSSQCTSPWCPSRLWAHWKVTQCNFFTPDQVPWAKTRPPDTYQQSALPGLAPLSYQSLLNRSLSGPFPETTIPRAFTPNNTVLSITGVHNPFTPLRWRFMGTCTSSRKVQLCVGPGVSPGLAGGIIYHD